MNLTEPQRRCIEESFGHPSALVAGAGSGKTATLTNRIVYALAHPDASGVADIDQILAITFTNKAADELRSRIKAALQVASATNPKLAEQALKVDGAWISTIHGMCSRLIRENAFTLGVDPKFSVLSEADMAALLDEAIEGALRLEEAQTVVGEYTSDTTKDMLKTLVHAAAESPMHAEQLFVCPPAPDIDGVLAKLVGYYQQIALEVKDDEGPKVQDWVERAHKALQTMREQIAASCEPSLPLEADPFTPLTSAELEAIQALPATQQYTLASTLPKIPKTPKAMNEVDLLGADSDGGSRAVVYPLIASLHYHTAAGFTHALVGMVSHALETYQEAKTRAGSMDNGDLMRYAHRLLTDPAYAHIGKDYGGRFKLVMVDEFQDTNQMQVDMISLLSGGKLGVPSARMCVVGDAQQSIYAFRGADLAVFQEYVRSVEDDATGDVIKMGHNFRSNPEILAFTKGAFERTFGTGEGGSYLELLPGRNEDELNAADKPKHVFHGAKGAVTNSEAAPDTAARTLPRRINVKVITTTHAQATNIAATTIADDFEQLIDAGHAPGEMAILLAGMRDAAVYASALQQRNIPCAITGGSVFSTATEPGLIMALCHALVDMYNTEALVKVLASPLFGLEAEDLLALFPQKKGYGINATSLTDRFVDQLRFLEDADSDMADPDMSVRLNNAISVLTHASTRVGRDPLHTIVGDVLVESGWLERLQKVGVPQAANAFKTLRLLEQLEQDENITGLELVRAAEASLQANKETPGVLSVEGDNFVHIMTIHASKGLQFPIVAVAEAYPPGKSEKSFMMRSQNGHQYLTLKLGTTGSDAGDVGKEAMKFTLEQSMTDDYDSQIAALSSDDAAAYRAAILGLLNTAEYEEYQRKLYVAYTRAEEALTVVMDDPTKAREAGEVNACTEIERVLTGGANFPITDDTAYACQTYPVSTTYDDPENGRMVVDWAARVEVFGNPSDEGEAGEDAAEEVEDATPDSSDDTTQDTPDAATDEIPGYGTTADFVVPTQLLTPLPGDQRLRLMWSQGILSASMLKHETLEEDEAQAQTQAQAQAQAQAQTQAQAQPQPQPQPTPADTPSDGSTDGLFDASFDGSTAAPLRQSTIDFGDDTTDTPDEHPASAVDKGTAFHALAEVAARVWQPGAQLAMPPDNRIDAIVRQYRLNSAQRQAVIDQLQAWIQSPVAQQMATQQHLVAEAPFWVKLADEATTPHARGPLVLQGFIDLLAYDTFGEGCALVVDYKTGASLATEKQRRSAYEIQAKVYAYALLCQGFDRVQLSFVFVEQPDESNHPQVVVFPAPGEADYTIEALRTELTELITEPDSSNSSDSPDTSNSTDEGSAAE